MISIDWLDALIAGKQHRNEPLPHPGKIMLIGDAGNKEIFSVAQLADCMHDVQLDRNHYVAIEEPFGGWVPSDFLWALIALRLYEKET